MVRSALETQRPAYPELWISREYSGPTAAEATHSRNCGATRNWYTKWYISGAQPSPVAVGNGQYPSEKAEGIRSNDEVLTATVGLAARTRNALTLKTQRMDHRTETHWPEGRLLPRAAVALLDSYASAHGVAPRVWVRGGDGWTVAHPRGCPDRSARLPDAIEIDAPPGQDLRIEVLGGPAEGADAAARFLASSLAQLLQHDHGVCFLSREIAERYEEITLLYSIPEILSAVVDLDLAAETILSEIVDTIGARRATLWVHEEERNHIRLAAAVGGPEVPSPIPTDDPCSMTALVFREKRPVVLALSEGFPRQGCLPVEDQADSQLWMPVTYTSGQSEERAVGVIHLVRHGSGLPFAEGELKLLAVIAKSITVAVVLGELQGRDPARGETESKPQ